MDSVKRSKTIIENNIHMTIATADINGKPWVSPVFFVNDADYNLYWVSSMEATHSLNIKSNPQVAIVIFGPVPPENKIDGVYFDAVARELSNVDEVTSAMQLLIEHIQESKFMIKSIADVTDKAIWRIYKATPKTIYKRADAVKHGQAITVREPIFLLEEES